MRWWRRRDREEDLDRELRSDLSLEIEEQIQAGLPAGEAQLAARRNFGNATLVKEEVRETWGWTSIERLAQDVRLAGRMMFRRPLFSVSAVLLLSLAIAVNTVFFCVMDAVWFRPLPFRDPDGIAAVWEKPPRNVQWKRSMLPFRDFLDLRRNNRSFETLAAAVARKYVVRIGERPESVAGEAITAGYLPMLGTPAAQGRTFLPSENSPDSEVVLSYGLWLRAFGGRNVVGQAITVNAKRNIIIGVMPSSFAFPTLDEETPELWTLLLSSDPYDGRVSVVGRLKPSVSRTTAESEAVALLREAHDRAPVAARPQGMMVRDLAVDRIEFATPVLAAFSSAAAFVLLIACANVAGLLLGQASERRHEMAIRFALGAGRSRVVRQMLTETLLLWVVAGTAGLLLSVTGVNMLRPFVGRVLPEFPQFNPIAINFPAIAYAVVTTLASGLLFGLLPALQGSRLDIMAALKQGGRGVIPSRQIHYWRKALIGCEVGFCVVLLIAAGLLLKSLVRLTTQPLGFRTGNDLTFKLELSSEKYTQPVERSLFYDRLLDQISHLPGVESVGATSALPLNGTVVFGFSVLGHSLNGGNFLPAAFEAISPDYFRAIGIPVLAGRTFAEHDSGRSSRVAIINQTVGHRYFGDENPIGRHIKLGEVTSDAPWMTIVGVVGDVKHAGLDWDYLPEIYLPYQQLDQRGYDAFASAMFFVVRLQHSFSVDNQIRAAVSSLDRDVAVADMMRTDELIESKELPSQSSSAIFAAFAGISLLLAAVGLYAIVSQTVLQRRQEIGIRMALGAQACDVIGNMMREGMVLAAAGGAVGVIGSVLLTHAIRSMLFDVTTTDPLVFVSVSVLFLAVAALASLVPALRAASANPLEVLRCE